MDTNDWCITSQVQSGSLIRINYSKRICLADPLSFERFHCFNGAHNISLFIVTAADVVSCGGPEM